MKTILYLNATSRRTSRMKFAGARRAATPLGYKLQIIDFGPMTSAQRKNLLDLWKPCGIIVDCGQLQGKEKVPDFSPIPSVFINLKSTTSRFSICTNDRAICLAAARELLQLNYDHYAFVGHFERRSWSELRLRHFQDAIETNNKRFHSFTQVANGDPVTRLRELGRWLTRIPKPCGLFAANDDDANQVLNLCSTAGLRIPEEIAVVGVDDDEYVCEHANPPLSSILPDMEKIGHTAMMTLHDIIRHRLKKPRIIEIGDNPILVRRASSRPKPSYGAPIRAAIELIREKACEGLCARDVVKTMRCSRHYAEMKFRDATGHTILDEIQEVRMERAKSLLSNPARSVAAVANLCGYRSPSAFCTQYKKAFGVLPRRKSARQTT